ncbi:FAD-binding oxidoreductase [Rhodococcus triatomae]|uniref:Alkyldihydroxyacetonephosphate synthase n=1 Tax=Rhodococcus triatomae TaxID=300028 RepID=A0A1G8HT44_9NOCA|nr:FAD-binding oxidoreductase [Rhodococcus triatomae]QNG21609.1 FAD-binding oxidoreductase [Rhodococcus triatomae]QNG25652.1 FAD-binding oxidoreductase [Rhodococcus triatomae]SDI09789.1 alkyldihydroxyacetonephosphate synthase [Rhodococcus triatomae]
MKWDAWGDPAAAKPLSDGIRSLLEQALGVDPDQNHSLDPSEVAVRPSALTEPHRTGLATIVGKEQVSTDDGDRLPRAGGKSTLDLLRRRSRGEQDAPDAVVIPGTEDEIAAILEFAAQEGLAVVPFGGGTSVVGGVDPVRGHFSASISLDLRRFDTLVSLDEVSGEAVLGAGVTGPRAEELLRAQGFSLGHFPQSFQYATIGGFAATRSSGQDSAGYGRFDEMIRGMRVVTPAGVLDLGKAPASAAGPDLVELFAGSEGTFGVITRVRLRVHAEPAVTRYEGWSFPDFATGAAALRAVEQTGTGPTVIRLSDEAETGINLATTDKIGADQITGGCLAVTLFEGSDEHTRSRHEETRAVLLAHGATSLGEEPAKLWEQGRFGAPYLRDSLLTAGALCETLETATTWSNLGTLKAAVTEALTSALGESGTPALVMCHISHVYPTGASLYFTVVAGQRGDVIEQWRAAKQRASDAIVAHGGTITHHHAVGTDHRPWMDSEVGELGTAILRAVKNTVDPAGILNPGKLIP